MAAPLPLYDLSGSALDSGVRLPLYDLSASALDSGVRLPVHLVGELALDSGVRLPIYAVGELAYDSGVVLPLYDLSGSALDSGVRLPSFAFSEEGAITGAIACTLPALTGAISGVLGIVGVLDVRLPALDEVLEPELVGYLEGRGSIAAALPGLTGSMTGLLGLTGALAGALPGLRATLAGGAQVVGALNATLPALTGYLVGDPEAPDTWHVLVMNLRTGAVTEYDDYEFNSFAEVDGVLYGASADGLYRLAGDDDDGTAIAAQFTTGVTDHGMRGLQRVTDAYLSGLSDEDVDFKVTIDGQTYTYRIPAKQYATFDVMKAGLGKGSKGRYWQYTVANRNGGALEVDGIDVVTVDAGRLVGRGK